MSRFNFAPMGIGEFLRTSGKVENSRYRERDPISSFFWNYNSTKILRHRLIVQLVIYLFYFSLAIVKRIDETEKRMIFFFLWQIIIGGLPFFFCNFSETWWWLSLLIWMRNGENPTAERIHTSRKKTLRIYETRSWVSVWTTIAEAFSYTNCAVWIVRIETNSFHGRNASRYHMQMIYNLEGK